MQTWLELKQWQLGPTLTFGCVGVVTLFEMPVLLTA